MNNQRSASVSERERSDGAELPCKSLYPKPPKFRLVIPDDVLGGTVNRGGQIAVAAYPPGRMTRRIVERLTGWRIEDVKPGERS